MLVDDEWRRPGGRRRGGDVRAGTHSAALCALAAPVAAALLLAGCTSTTSTTAVTSSTPPAGVDHHKWVAERDAAALLAAYAPPPNAHRLTGAPRGSFVDLPPSTQAVGTLLDVARFWSVPGTMAGVIAWSRSHAPDGGRVTEVGTDGRSLPGATRGPGGLAQVATDVQSRNLTFTLPVRSAALSSRQVLVSVAASGTRDVTMRVDVQEVWLPTRPDWSFAPRGTTSVTATIWVGAGGTDARSATSTSRATIASFRRVVDAMAVWPPGRLEACAAESGQRFRLVLAVHDSRRMVLTSVVPECGGVEVLVHGRAPIALEDRGEALLASVESLAGASDGR
jgi:hypothetical protein